MGDTVRYELDFLLHLKDSPLCVKPKDLPPAEEYMGLPQEATRPAPKTTTDRPFGALPTSKIEPGTRRPTTDRHGSRNGTSDGLVLAPPRNNFSSTSRTPFGDSDRASKTPHDIEIHDRLMRGKMGTIGVDTETRGGRRGTFRGREDGEREGEGWNKGKPSKSVGQDGAERFTGRMGGDQRQQRDDRGKERDDQVGAKERRRTFEADGEDGDAPRRNGLARGKTDTWFNLETTPKPVDPAERAMNRERIEKAKSWRTQDPEERQGNARGDRNSERHERRWDREPRQERDPEWMGLGDPAEEKKAAHTQEDFAKAMETLRGGSKAAEKPAEAGEGPPGLPSFFGDSTFAGKAAPAVEQRPDKFFAKFSETSATVLGEDKAEGTTAPQPVMQSSKFANFFPARTEPSTPAVVAPPAPAPQPPASSNGGGPVDDAAHFESLMSKLRGAPQASPTPPNVNAYPQPQAPLLPSTQSPIVPFDPMRNLLHTFDQKASLNSPDPQLPFGGMSHPEEPRLRSVPPTRPEIMAPRPLQPPTQPPTVPHDQLIHELLAQRQVTQSQGSGRTASVADQHTAHLMQLMQQPMPDQRPVEAFARLPPQVQRQPPMHQQQHYEPEPSHFMREHGLAQQRQMQPPAGFENQFRRSEGDGRMMQQQQQQQQPPPHLHILQRQQMIPPGLDHGVPLQHQMWPGQQLPPGQRQGPMIQPPQMQQGGRPPPGLPFGAMGGGPVLGGMPPNMMQHNDNIPGLSRNMPPPGFFTNGPPAPGGPGSAFMPPAMGNPYPGPEQFFPPGHYDGRGGMPPPPGSFRR